jgi:ribosome-associated protein
MDIRKLQRAIVDGLEDVKAQNIAVFNTEALSPLFERVIIASGTSNRQTRALASSVRDTVKARGMPVLSVEGEAGGEWIIVDCGAAVAHIMQPAIRDYYHLEEIWGGRHVRMKLGGDAPAARRAAAADPPPKPAAKAAPESKRAANAAPGSGGKVKTKAGAKTAARPAAKAGARKAAPKRTASATVRTPAAPARRTPPR